MVFLQTLRSFVRDRKKPRHKHDELVSGNTLRNYAVTIHGRGFNVPIESDEGTAAGFFVSVLLHAEDEDDACDRALRILVEDPEFTERIGAHADPETAELLISQWYELRSFDGFEMPRSGFIFYGSEGPDDME